MSTVSTTSNHSLEQFGMSTSGGLHEKIGRFELALLGLISLIFLEHVVYVITRVRLMNAFYGIGALLMVVGFVRSPIHERVAAGLFAYAGVVCVFAMYGVLVNNNLSVSIQQSVYYLKPVLFFFLGYFFFSERSFSKLVNFIWWLSVSGTVAFYLFSQQLIDMAAEHLNLATFGFYEAFGLVSRNISWYVSPLEFGALCMFLGFYMVECRQRYWRWKTALTILMACSTFSRSVILAGLVAFSLSKVRLTPRNIALLIIVVLAGILTVFYFDEFFLQYFVHDGSASVHNEVLRDSIELVLTHPLGLGIGSSGWPGYDEGLHWYFYSEGTVGMLLIELGWLGFVILAMLAIASFRVSRKFGFLCVAFLFTCLLVPVGVSTFFVCLYFLFFGMKVKRSYV
jgi:hypothetical protein